MLIINHKWLPCHRLFYYFSTKVFTGKMRYIISSSVSLSILGFPISWVCLKPCIGSLLRSILVRCLNPPNWLLPKQARVGCLCSQTHSSCHYSKHREVDELVNQKVCLPAQFPLHHTSAAQSLNYCWHRTAVNLLIHFTSTWEELVKTLRYLNSSSYGGYSFEPEENNRLFVKGEQWPQIWVLTLIPTVHTELQTPQLERYSLMKQIEPYHLDTWNQIQKNKKLI